MSYRTKFHMTAACAAVMCLGLIVPGCITKRDVDEIKSRLSSLEAQNRENQRLVAKMDSIITAGAESNDRMRTDIRTSTDDLGRQIQQLLTNFNELSDQVAKMSRGSSTSRRLDSSPGAQTNPTVSQQCTESYDAAFLLMKGGQYDRAVDNFRKYLQDCPNDANNENAYYWIGESYYSTEKYNEAITEFEYLLANYRNSNKAVAALYKLGRSRQELGQKAEARKIYQRIISEFTNTLEAEQAKERLKDLK